MVQDLTADDPSHVRPPTAIARAVRIAFPVAGLMMDAVRADPEDRSTLESECGTGGEEIFNPFWNFVSAMGQEPVISHADSTAQREIPENGRNQQRLPAEHEQRGDCPNMENRHYESGVPVDLASFRCVNLRGGRLRKSVGCNDCAHSLRLLSGQHLSP